MSHIRTKIKYKIEGNYGSEEECILYCDRNNCCDITSFYDEHGNLLFCYNDTLNNNLGDKIVEMIKNGDPDKNPNVQYMDVNDRKKINR